MDESAGLLRLPRGRGHTYKILRAAKGEKRLQKDGHLQDERVSQLDDGARSCPHRSREDVPRCNQEEEMAASRSAL